MKHAVCACLTFPVIFRALPHSPQTHLVLHWTAASASCSLWAAPLSSFSLWASWPEGAGRSSSPAWHPLSLSVKRKRSIMFVCKYCCFCVRKKKTQV